jgi:hypothetical protein
MNTRRLLFLALPLAALTVSAFALTTKSVAKPRPDVAVSVNGPRGTEKKALSEIMGAKGLVLIFTGTQCPIANSYAPDIAKWAIDWKEKGVNIALVYANPGDAGKLTAHANEYKLSGVTQINDPLHQLTDKFGATVTPESFVLNADSKVVYTGRLDDKYVDRGKPKGSPVAKHDLKNAVMALVNNTPQPVAKIKAFGCVIESPIEKVPTSPTYAKDVAKILNENCVSCHRAGEIGPMRLDNVESARAFAQNIADVADRRFMPPWKPLENHGKFAGERKLSEAQIETLKVWAQSNAPAGDIAKVPTLPKFTSGWSLGKPDLILKMPKPWKVAASGEDIYQCFVIPTGVTKDMQVAAVEYRAGNSKVVHHVIGYLDTKGAARKLEAANPDDGYTSFGGPGFLPSGELGGWAPGNLPKFLPDGLARTLPANSDLVMQVHYHANGKEEEDVTQVGIYFSKKPASKEFVSYPILANVNIPAGEKNYVTEQTISVPGDITLYAVTPHMHLLGRTIGMELTLPNGKKQPLIQINDWDFNWQDTYYYQTPMRIPKGSKITLKATYDNSENNPRNPNSPPKKVTFGEATTDEMCVGFIGMVADSPNDPMASFFKRLRGR